MARIEVKQEIMIQEKKNREKRQNNKTKLYTLSIPPTPQVPFLQADRHSEIIRAFEDGCPAFFTMNSYGEVDFYFYLTDDEYFEDFVESPENYKVYFIDADVLEVIVFYDDERAAFPLVFNLRSPMERHVLAWLAKKKRVNVYYIVNYEDEYFCTGLKVADLPLAFAYDLERFLNGERALLLPAFAETVLESGFFNQDLLLHHGWGFYINYSALSKRIGSNEDTDEILSRHLLDLTACLQSNWCLFRKDQETEKNELMLIWVGKKIRLFQENQPDEYYCIYLTGDFVQNESQNPVKTVAMEALKEIPELEHTSWIAPLAEESIPLVALQGSLPYRLNLTNDFYYLSDRLFKEYFLPHNEYVSYYSYAVNDRRLSPQGAKVYSLVKKRQEKGFFADKDMTPADVLHLAKWGNEEDLAAIFAHLNLLQGSKLDEAIYILSQKYKQLLEPYFFSLLETGPGEEMYDAVLLGLGLIESVKGVPIMTGRLQGTAKEAAVAFDALLLVGDPAIPHLIPLLQNAKAGIRLRAVKLLGTLGSEKALAVLRKMAEDRSVRVEKARRAFLKGLDQLEQERL
ncbi:MAG TPA: HEAT repeat domain-containing protein [Clostridia bacterium]|jgi:hypothetical protein|nr:HEAT repeat domain-containing protein [Clostridia bacterium]